jgi:hypothetical protein
MKRWEDMNGFFCVLLIGMIVTSGCLGTTNGATGTSTQNSGESVADEVLSKNLTETDAYDPKDEKLPIIKVQPNSSQITVISTGMIGGCTQSTISHLNYERNNHSLTVVFGTERASSGPSACNATVGTTVLNATFRFDGQMPQSVTVSYVDSDTITMTNVTKTVSPT